MSAPPIPNQEIEAALLQAARSLNGRGSEGAPFQGTNVTTEPRP